MIEEGQLSAAQLTDMGICPTCFDRENGNCLYGENSSRMIFSNEQFECFIKKGVQSRKRISLYYVRWPNEPFSHPIDS